MKRFQLDLTAAGVHHAQERECVKEDAKIIWNESHDSGGVRGMDEIVPLSWLYVPMVSP